MPKGVKANPTAKAVTLLERELEKITKKLSKYDQLLRDREQVRRALAALKGAPMVGMDAGGVHHVVQSRRQA